MSWVVTGMAAVGALSASQQRKAQQNANQQSADVTAAQTEYSPWTGIKPQGFTPTAPTSTVLGGAATGALSGAMFSAANKKTPMEQGAADVGKPQANPMSWSGNDASTMTEEQKRKMMGLA